MYPKQEPMFLRAVESLKSLCILDIDSFELRWVNNALAIPKFPSAFSKSIGLILCGIVEEPTSFFFISCSK